MKIYKVKIADSPSPNLALKVKRIAEKINDEDLRDELNKLSKSLAKNAEEGRKFLEDVASNKLRRFLENKYPFTMQYLVGGDDL